MNAAMCDGFGDVACVGLVSRRGNNVGLLPRSGTADISKSIVL